MATESPTPSVGSCGLKANCLSFPEVLSQCVANISPTLTPMLIVPLVFASAGNGTWLAYGLATVGLVLVGLNLNQFARRSASPGSLYSYVAQGLGENAGFLAGWCLILAYLFTGSAVMSGSVNYATILLGLIGLKVPPLALYALGTALAWLVAYKDVKLSTQLMLVLEAVSMVLILVLGVLVLVHRGRLVDAAQFNFRAMDGAGLKAGLILAIFSFVGYESAATLGAEARRPLVNIPRAIISSAVISGLFFMVTAYVAVLGFKGLGKSLATSDAPFNELARDAGVTSFGIFISIGAVVSTFACTLASINAGARIVFSLGRQGIFHPKLGQAHRTNETPHHSVTLLSLLVLAGPAVLLASHISVLDIFNDLSTVATYGFLVVYALVPLAAVAYVKRLGKLTLGHLLLAAGAILCLVPALIATVYPAPPPPLNRLPYLFLGYVTVGWIWFAIRHRRSGKRLHESEAAPTAAAAAAK